MADPINREHLEWLREIAFDPRVGGASTKGAIALTRYFNRQTGDTFVSLETLGNALGVSARQAARMIDELESTGHLNAERIGKRKPNRYSPRRLADSGDASVPGHKTSAHQDPVTGRFMSAHKPEVCGHFEAKCTDTKRPANPSIDPGRERSSPYGLSLSRQRARVFREGFTRFWWTYPRRVAQADARRAFEEALTLQGGPTVEEIIEGASRFAEARACEDEQFTPHPAKWLRDGRWADE